MALHLTIGDQQIDFPALPRLLSKCVQLRSLNLHNVDHMSDDALATLVIPSKHMNELRIYRASHISDGAMMAFLAQLRDTGAQLEDLGLRVCKMLTGATLRHIAMLFPRIKRVDMRDTGVTDDLLVNVITQWPAITDVQLGGISYKRTAEGCELDLTGSTWPANFAMLLAACPAPIRKLFTGYAVPCPSSMRLIEERVRLIYTIWLFI